MFLGLRLLFFLFLLRDLSHIENRTGLQVSLGSLLWGLEGRLSLKIGMSARKVLNFCDRSSGETFVTAHLGMLLLAFRFGVHVLQKIIKQFPER